MYASSQIRVKGTNKEDTKGGALFMVVFSNINH